jgi:general secretion pathway protein A
MYLDFYKLKKNPFHITPDPEFLFLSSSHKEASAALIYGIEERKGFIAITGEIGVGKTTILRAYLEGADREKLKVVYIFNAVLSFESLLKQIFNELGLVAEQGAGVPELVNQLHRFLIEEYKNDRNVALIIDEAQNMPVETLENLRMLSNLETSKDKLVQIVLVGQPEFERKLELTELRQLKQRIAIRCLIKPLDREESLAYIQHRLMRGSSFHNQVFTKGALNRIVDETKGFPRLINILCDNVLITGFGLQRNPATEKIVKEVISDFRGRKPRGIFRRVWPAAAIVCAGVILSAVFLSRSIENRTGGETLRLSGKQEVVAPVPAPALDLSVPQALPVNRTISDIQPQISEVAPPEQIKPPPEAKAPSPPENQPMIEEASQKVADVQKQEPAPVAAFSDEPQERESGLVSRTVIKGDSVSQILVEIYGYCDPELLRSFKEVNPQLKDPNKIAVGEQLQLPRLSSPKPRAR